MRRRLIAASILVFMVSLAGGPVVSAAPRDEGTGWERWMEAVMGLFRGKELPAIVESEILQDGVCADPWGRVAGGASCPVPPPAPVTSAPDDPNL